MGIPNMGTGDLTRTRNRSILIRVSNDAKIVRSGDVQCNTYMLFAGREVRIEKNCARGLQYDPRLQAEGRTQERWHSFSQYGPT